MFHFGKSLQITIFGQSHSSSIGVVMEGLPAGIPIDLDAVQRFMARRAPGRDETTTSRKESDMPDIVAGLVDHVTCGAPLCALIANRDSRSKDYDALKDVPRPMHADYPAFVKHQGWNDIRGGGQFSGRLTAPLCLAGAICLRWLKTKGVTIGSHIASIGTISDTPFDPVAISADELQCLAEHPFPVRCGTIAVKMREEISMANAEQDSVGGVIECCAVGVPAGLGDPMFDGMENRLAQAFFGIPAVKGVEFGAGFGASQLRGSQHNDEFIIDQTGEIRTKTNRHGGILGGMTTGMPILARVAFKPTSSIGKTQQSVSLSQRVPVELRIEGRHDPCIVARAAAPVEAAMAIVLADLMMNMEN